MAERESVLLPRCCASGYSAFADLSFFPVPIGYDMSAAGIVSEQKLLIGYKNMENQERVA